MTLKEKYYRYGYLALTNEKDGEWVREALVNEYGFKLKEGKFLKKVFRNCTIPKFYQLFIQDEVAFKGHNSIEVGHAIKDMTERLNGCQYICDPYGMIR